MSSQRVVVITGGNSGMGQATAAAFARANEHVIIIGRSEERLQATAQELGSNVTWLKADVSQRSQVEGAVAAIIEQFGHVDVLINAAGFVLGVTTDLPLDVLGLTYGLARELSPQGITVNAIAPGFIANTGFTGEWSEERVRGIIAETPVGRGGHGSDVVAAALYLSSPEASFVTGEVLNVNGGWLFGH